MSNELEDIARCLFNGQIPNGWRRLAPDTLKNLGNWILHFNGRLEQYNKWVCGSLELCTSMCVCVPVCVPVCGCPFLLSLEIKFCDLLRNPNLIVKSL